MSGEDNADYTDVATKIAKYVSAFKNSDQRYQDIDERKEKSPRSLHLESELSLARGKYHFVYRNTSVMKDCREMMVYQSILSDIKPQTIIELGTYQGGGALWLADMTKGMDIQCHVFTIEKFGDLVKPEARSHPRVTCITGDAHDITTLMPGEMLSKLAHPWLVIEDCHCNVFGAMEFFGKYMTPGDYFAIEDTNDQYPYYYSLDVMDAGLADAENMPIAGQECVSYKYEELVRFMQKHKGKFKVDSYYTDRFGFNGTATRDGYIRKM